MTRERVAFLDAISQERSGGLFGQAVAELRLAVENFERAYGHLAVQHEELRTAEAALRVAEGRYRSLFSSTAEAYLVTDAEGVIIEANPTAGVLLGLVGDLLLGEPLADFVAAADRTAFTQRLDTLGDIGHVADWSVRVQPRAGTPFPALLTVTADWFAEDVMALRWRLRPEGERTGDDADAGRGSAVRMPGAAAPVRRCVTAAAALPGVVGAAVLLAEGTGGLRIAGTSAGFAAELEDAQIEVARGPSVLAVRSGEAVVEPDLGRAGRRGWPWLARRAGSAGASAVASYPLLDDAGPLGALTLYLSELPAPATTAAAQALAAALADALRAGVALQASRALAEQLEHALDARVVIEHATGMLAERHGLDPETAQGHLVRGARTDRVRLAAYAGRVVAGRIDPIAERVPTAGPRRLHDPGAPPAA